MERSRLVEDGRAAFVAGDFPAALGAFREAVALDPTDTAAVLGLARSSHELHLYDEALELYELALERRPGEALAWEGYLGALVWGGILEGNGRRLGTALDVGERALMSVPQSVDSYAHLRTGAAELNRLDDYGALLERVATALPDDPVVEIELARLRLEEARRVANSAASASAAATGGRSPAAQRVAELEKELREALAGAESPRGDPSAGTYYKLAVGYDLLGDRERADDALTALDSTDEGHRMAAGLLHDRFMSEWMRGFREDVDTRLDVTERWLRRLSSRWSTNPTRYRAILDLQFGLLVDNAGEGLTVERADRIAAAGRRLARWDTWGAAQAYVRTAGVLARTPSHYVVAVRVADEGIDRLRNNDPGLMYPGTPEVERESLRLRYVAVLMQLQGQALHNLGRDDEAEQVLREAIALHPVAASYAVLGGLLLDQDRGAEAFDLLVAALAHGFAPNEEPLMRQTEASAREAANRIGADPEVIVAAVAFSAERINEEREREILADPLDLPAPDFTLEDTEGVVWRLAEHAGKVVVLNYWATWCGPCIAEMPYYSQLVDEYADAADVMFFAISTDEDPSVVAPFLAERDLEFTVLYDRGSAVDFRVTGIPASFVIGADGLIKYRTSGFPGPDRYLREMRLRIEALRSQAPSDARTNQQEERHP